MRLFLGLLLLLVSTFDLSAQNFTGIIPNSSPASTLFLGRSASLISEKEISPAKTYISAPLLLSEASFILAQASICPDWKDLEELQAYGLEAWIERQTQVRPSFLTRKVEKWQLLVADLIGESATQTSLAYQLGKWHNTLTAKDQLRQQIAVTLDDILLAPQSLDSFGFSSLEQGRYFDLLLKHALGNYQDLLRELAVDSTLHVILSHQRADFYADQKLQAGLEQVFNHPHTKFQVAEALIKTLIGQSPSREFVQRVARIFEGNEEVERGDLRAMIYAIYSDSEAKLQVNHSAQLDKALLLEPMLRYTGICETLEAISLQELLTYLSEENKLLEEGEEAFLNSPNVFSFFIPPVEFFDPAEKQVEQNSLADLMLNFILEVQGQNLAKSAFYEEPLGHEAEVSDDLDEIFELTGDPHEFLEYLDLLFVQGLLSDYKKGLIEQAISEIKYPEDRFSVALYLIFISSEYKNLP